MGNDTQEIRFKLNKIYYPHIYFEFNPLLKENIPTSISMEYNVTINGEIKVKKRDIYCYVNIHMKIGSKENDDIARMHVSVCGYFEAEQEFDDVTLKKFSANLYSIVFPYVRQISNDIMIRNGIQFIIPILNIAAIINENENCFTIRREDDDTKKSI